jgi:hypothetical protein
MPHEVFVELKNVPRLSTILEELSNKWRIYIHYRSSNSRACVHYDQAQIHVIRSWAEVRVDEPIHFKLLYTQHILEERKVVNQRVQELRRSFAERCLCVRIVLDARDTT